MSNPKFTPGPLQVCNGTDVFTESGAANRAGVSAAPNDGWQTADCMVGKTFVGSDGTESELPYSEQAANARLYAAAPEMYALLESYIRDGESPLKALSFAEFRDEWRKLRTRINGGE